jgi:hypothetical protein
MSDASEQPNQARAPIRLANGQLHIFDRNGIFHARILVKPYTYFYRTLKTRNQQQAIEAGRKLLHTIEFKQGAGLPVTSRSFNSVIDEYVQFRTKQHAQGHTSIHMLRQIESRAQILAASVTPKIHWIMPFDLKQRARPSH